ncbi:MAG TPA: hypothetical protein VFB62_05445 [Polyangiaceae bacterium]|nr:hypothetical protein [Polyangiaceae bacterium]
MGRGCLIVALVATSAVANAQPPPDPDALKNSCLEAFDESQHLRRDRKLLQTRERLVVCGQAGCPDAVRAKCVEWREQVERDVPTIVIAARDADADVADAQVYLDGKLVSKRLDGNALELDPGPHEVRLVRGKREQRQSVVIRQGEKNRVVRIDFAKPAAAKKPPRKPPPKKPPQEPARGFDMPVLSWIGFSTGAAALAVGAVTGIVALVKGDELETVCEAGICHPPEKRDLEAGLAVAHVSTISFAVAGVGIAVGIVGLLVMGNDDEAEKKAKAGAMLSLGPGSIGGTAWW